MKIPVERVRSAVVYVLKNPLSPDPKEFVDAYARSLGVLVNNLTSDGHHHTLASLRAGAYVVLRERYGLTLTEIGTLFGGRDHSTISISLRTYGSQFHLEDILSCSDTVISLHNKML